MINRGKVIRHIIAEISIAKTCKKDFASVDIDMLSDVLELLKEQSVEPKQVDLHEEDEWYGPVCVCPDCKTEWMCEKADTHFCPKCGRSVKWE